MHGRFEMEYRLFTIVRYNYRDYNTPSKPNMHAKVKTMQKETRDKHWIQANFREAARQQENFKKLEGRLPTGGKKAKKRWSQARAKARIMQEQEEV